MYTRTEYASHASMASSCIPGIILQHFYIFAGVGTRVLVALLLQYL